MPKYELALPGGILSAKSGHELLRKIEAEAEFWSIFSELKPRSLISQPSYSPPWIGQAVEYIKEIVAFWPRHFEVAKAVATIGDEAYLKLKSGVETAAVKPPYSAGRVATLAKRLASKGKMQEAVCLLAGSSGQPFAQFGTSQNQSIEQGAFISFGRSLATFVDLGSESAGNAEAHTQALNDARVIESLSSDMGLLLNETISTRDQFFSASERASKTFFAKVKRLREAEIKYFRKARSEERLRRTEQTSELQSLIEAFSAHLRLKRPVELWKERNEEHDRASASAWGKFLWGSVLLGVSAIFVAVFLGGVIADSFTPAGCISGSEAQCGRISARGLLNISLLLIVTTTWLWYLRLQMKIFLSERHLALDARERMAFAETYLSLLKGAEVSREQETVVLQSLMRPTQDGIIKDESGPDFALSGLLARALERK
jgi:Family of unknown function (DUF6161)